jgi:hypothetical protein
MPRRLEICHKEKDKLGEGRTDFQGPDREASPDPWGRKDLEGTPLGPPRALTCIQFSVWLSQAHGDAKASLVLLQHLKQLVLSHVGRRRDGGRVADVDKNLAF